MMINWKNKWHHVKEREEEGEKPRTWTNLCMVGAVMMVVKVAMIVAETVFFLCLPPRVYTHFDPCAYTHFDPSVYNH